MSEELANVREHILHEMIRRHIVDAASYLQEKELTANCFAISSFQLNADLSVSAPLT